VADVVRRRPVAPEVPVLDEQVGGGDDPPVGRRDDRGVVPRSDQGRVELGQTRGDPPDQPEFAEIRNGDDPRPFRRCGPAAAAKVSQRAQWPALRSTGQSDTTTTGTPHRANAAREPPAAHCVVGRSEARASMSVNAYILIQTEVGKAAAVASEIANLKGVTNAEDVTGPYDVIVRAEARSVDELGKLVVAKVQAVDGITRTLTCPVVHL
jgi:DNA-binding Lrp family transcriptional regulator